jgi:hypothetical protein
MFVQQFLKNLTPTVPGPTPGTIAGGGYALNLFNEALEYAETTPSKTFGTPHLVYPYKSSVFRSLLRQASKGFWVGLLTDVILAEAKALWVEYQAVRQGTCQ